jgi:K+-transporting ATPase KdpF subunit
MSAAEAAMLALSVLMMLYLVYALLRGEEL